MQISTHPSSACPLLLVALRPLFADVLPNLKLAQPLDHERPDQQADQQRRQARKHASETSHTGKMRNTRK